MRAKDDLPAAAQGPDVAKTILLASVLLDASPSQLVERSFTRLLSQQLSYRLSLDATSAVKRTAGSAKQGSPHTPAKKPLLPLCVRPQRTRGHTRHHSSLLTAQRPIFTFDGRPPPVALAVAADRIHGAEI